MKNIVIKFTNMKAVRVGKGIKEFRQRCNLLPKQLAEKVGITESYLCRLEEGYAPEVESATLENIAQALRVCERGTLTYEQLINLFLDVTKKDDHPMLI